MGDYIDKVVVKLKRQYSKDELVAHLTKKQSELEVELGVVKSERDEAIDKLNKVLKLDNDTKSRIGQMALYKNLKSEVRALRKKCNKAVREKHDLMAKVVQLQINQNKK